MVYTMILQVFILVALITIRGTKSEDCLFNVQDGCSCVQEESFVTLTCVLNDRTNTNESMITSNLTEPISINILNLSNNNLTSLNPNFFENIESVSEFRLSRNGFTTNPVPSFLTKNVRKLYMPFNEMTELNLNNFVSLSSLKELYVSHNQIIHVTGSGPRMHKLDISHNLLPNVSDSLWRISEELDLSHNALTLINKAPPCQIQILYLNGNQIKEISGKSFIDTPNLQQIHIRDNRLTKIHSETFYGAWELTEIDIADNFLSNLEVATFKYLPSLSTINLDRNKIKNIKSRVFYGLEDTLSRLSLKGNNVSYIHVKAFSELKSLRFIDLSDNIGLRDVSAIEFPEHILFLDLSNCSLSIIQDCKFLSYQSLQFLGLAANNFNCSCHLSWLHDWQKTIRTYIYRSDDEIIPNWECYDTNSRLQQVSYERSACNETGHTPHCPLTRQQLLLDPSAISLNITVKVEEKIITAKWSMKSAIKIHGFVVTYASKDDTVFESPLLKSSVNQYVIRDMKVIGTYTVCVHAKLNETFTIKKVCKVEDSNFLQMIIGILAGIVFLVPCLSALAYILCKDYQVMKDYNYVHDKDSIVDNNHEHKHEIEVKSEKSNVTDTPMIEVPCYAVVPIEQMENHAVKETLDTGTDNHAANTEIAVSMDNPAFEVDIVDPVPGPGFTEINTKL